MAKATQPRLTFYNGAHCWWRGQFVKVLRWRVAPDGKLLVEVREIDRHLNGVALVPEEELFGVAKEEKDE